MATDNALCGKHKVLKLVTVQFSTANFSRLSMNPVVRLKGKPSSTLIVRQTYVATLEKAC